MKRLTLILASFILFTIVFCSSLAMAATTAISLAVSSVVSLPAMASYCQAPPIKTQVSPNIMLDVDVSGSMGWDAYAYGDSDANHDGVLDNYDPNTQYEGYFDPSKYYVLDTASSNYMEVTPTGVACQKTTCNQWSCSRTDTGGCSPKGTNGCSSSRYSCCTGWNTTGDCGLTSGNYLNYEKMARIDLIRWAMTGGRPASCAGMQAGNGAYCDPETWADSGNASKVGAVCNNSLVIVQGGVPEGGCTLQLNNGDTVNVRWNRVYAGLAFQFAKLPVVPNMGAMFFEGSGIRADKVYVGDFTSATSKTVYPFYNLITQVNSQDPGGSTPTGPAMWDTLNYFAQKAPQYGGFAVQSGSGDRWKNPMYTCQNGGTNCLFIPCASNFVILMSDGQWNQPSCSIGTASSTSPDPVVPAYQMHKDFLNTAVSVTTHVSGVYTIGLFLGGTGQLAMENIAMYGSFDRSSKNWPDSLTGYPMNSCTAADCGGTAKGSPCTALPASSADWDVDGDGVPDTFYNGNNATQIKNSMMSAILDILSQTTAGTAASVLASREGSGANLIQAVYYPKRVFTNGTVAWVGSMQNMWYYIDPSFSNSTIREDGRDSAGNHDFIMNLLTLGQTQKDYITAFRYDSGLQAAVADRWTDDDGDGSVLGETKLAPIKIDTVANLWEAGQQLWSKYFLNRTIYTVNLTGTATTNNLMPFACAGVNDCPLKSLLKPYLNATDSSGVLSDDVASTIIEWTLGNQYAKTSAYVPSYRTRAAQIGSVANVWKLGDIVNSTPKISSWQPLGDYNIQYPKYELTYGPLGTNPYQSDPVDPKYYITSASYKGRGMVYAGANDGMLHAFRLGLLQSKWSGQGAYQKAKLTNKVCSTSKNIFCSDNTQCPGGQTCSGTVTLGEEAWAFIPKNALPYLKYMADPSYCHVYTIDMTPLVFDASIAAPTGGCLQPNYYDCLKQASSWRTVLIGGMRLGGGCRNPEDTCTSCVNTPIYDPDNPKKGLGYSSYFALDITDQNNPKLMWEYDGTVMNPDGTFTNKLGMSYSGPAVLRVSNFATGSTYNAGVRNGRWFVVFGSGPTGPIQTTYQQFLGRSDQNLTLHIFDLATGPGVNNSNVTVLDTGIAYGFSGSITTTTFDVDLDYSDDVLYVPVVYGAAGLNGGLGRLVTYGSIDPSKWKWSMVMTETGPVTAAPAMLMDPDTKDLWIYFGTGRYFYDYVNATDDPNPPQRRQLIALKERCLNSTKTGFATTCPSAPVFCGAPAGVTSCGGLVNGDAGGVDPSVSGYKGCYLDLLPPGIVDNVSYWGERVITNPSVDPAGIIYWTSFTPQNDPCAKGGRTYLRAAKFDNCGSAAGLVSGTALIQLSTGSIEQVDLKKIFGPSTPEGPPVPVSMIGMPPTGQGLTVIPGEVGLSTPLFIKER